MQNRVFASRAATLIALGSLAIGPLAGCSSGAGPGLPGAPALNAATGTTNAAPGAAAHALGSQALASIPNTKQKLLFVSDNENNRISVFDAATTTQNPPALYAITSGVSGPNGLATDKMGNLYVANYVSNTVSIYAPRSTTPKATLSSGLNGPFDVKVDAFGTVYVANDPLNGQTGFIVEYPNGTTYPTYTWTAPSQGMVISGIALLNPMQRGSTSMYALGYTLNGSGFASGSALTCYPGSSTCTALGHTFGQTGGIAVSESPGLNKPFQWLAVDQYVPGVDIFTLNQPMSQLLTGGTPEFITLDAKDKNLFVADRFYGRVVKYSYPGRKQLNTYAGGAQVYGVATYPSGSLH